MDSVAANCWLVPLALNMEAFYLGYSDETKTEL